MVQRKVRGRVAFKNRTILIAGLPRMRAALICVALACVALATDDVADGASARAAPLRQSLADRSARPFLTCAAATAAVPGVPKVVAEENKATVRTYDKVAYAAHKLRLYTALEKVGSRLRAQPPPPLLHPLRPRGVADLPPQALLARQEVREHAQVPEQAEGVAGEEDHSLTQEARWVQRRNSGSGPCRLAARSPSLQSASLRCSGERGAAPW